MTRSDCPTTPTPITAPGRLLVLACSATKRHDPGRIPARDRYDGPLWRTLRATDPDGRQAKVAFLSGRFGFRDAATPIEDYDSKLTAELAQRMIAGGMTTRWPRPPLPRCPDNYGMHPGAEIASLARHGAEPFADIALVGGHRYLAVMRALLSGFISMGRVASNPRIVEINGPIGIMRQQLRTWLAISPRSCPPAPGRPSVQALPGVVRCPALQRKRAAQVFVAGWKAREGLSAPVTETIPMQAAVQKITLSSSRDIPFNKLKLSQSNVRRVKAGISIEELAEDIARRTLLQGLSVRPLLDADGVETGMFEIPAGGRRYRALELLVKQKRLAKTAPVPCVVRDPATEILAEADSLAENVQRAPLHPLDQFRAFQALREKGQTEEDIAAAFFVAANVVKQRLRLSAVSEKLLDLYAEDALSLDQLMAFTVTTDHARQEQVWDAIQHAYSKDPYHIRRMLTERAVPASDKRTRFVGLDAYEAADGLIMRDLFQQDGGGWLENVALLDSLVADKLRAEAETIAGEGWKWVEVNVDFRYGHTRGLRELDGTPANLTAEEQSIIDDLNAEYAQLEAEYEDADELPDEVDQRFGEIEAALAPFKNRPLIYDPIEIARAGSFVSIDNDGSLRVDRGYVRPEDEAPDEPPAMVAGEDDAETAPDAPEGTEPTAPTVQRAVITIGGQTEPEEDEGEEDVIKPLPDRLLGELSAHRTLALRDALANNPHVAMTALLHKLCVDTFRHGSPYACLEAAVRNVSFPVQQTDLKTTPSAKSIDERHTAWKTDLPKDEDALWDWLAVLPEARRAALLAHCVSFGVNALHERADRHGGPGISVHGLQRRLAPADRLAQAVGLDMVEAGWRPTVDTYLGRVTKPRILEAVREAKGEHAAQLIDHLKKADMAKEAERLLDGTGWLPEPLRSADTEIATDAQTDAVSTLPDFLANDDDEPAAEDADEPEPIAATM